MSKLTIHTQKNERLSDFSMEDIVDEVVKETKKHFEDYDSDSSEDVIDVGYALGMALNKWMPNMLTNIAEDAMDKLGYLKEDYGKFFDAIETAVEYSHKE